MARITKKQKEARSKVDSKNFYSLKQASSLVKEITNTEFDASIDMAIRLGVDPKKANQMVRGVVTLPHGTGKNIRVLALVTPDKESDAKESGADFAKFQTWSTPALRHCRLERVWSRSCDHMAKWIRFSYWQWILQRPLTAQSG